MGPWCPFHAPCLRQVRTTDLPHHQTLHCPLQREAGCSQDVAPEGQEAEGCIAAGGGREKASGAVQRSGIGLRQEGLGLWHGDFQVLP